MKKNIRAAQVRLKRIDEARKIKIAIKIANAIREVEVMTADRKRIETKLAEITTELRVAEGAGFDRESHWKHMAKLRLMLEDIDRKLSARRVAAGLPLVPPPSAPLCPEIAAHLDAIGLDRVHA